MPFSLSSSSIDNLVWFDKETSISRASFRKTRFANGRDAWRRMEEKKKEKKKKKFFFERIALPYLQVGFTVDWSAQERAGRVNAS